jgi:tetratricopeptide (TPR) repeat protein
MAPQARRRCARVAAEGFGDMDVRDRAVGRSLAEEVRRHGDGTQLLRELATLGMDGLAAGLIERAGDDAAVRADAWMALADGALFAGRQTEASAHLSSALTAMADLTGGSRDEALARAVELAVDLGDLAAARGAAERVADAFLRSVGFSRIAGAALASGAVDAAWGDGQRAARAVADVSATRDPLRDDVGRGEALAGLWCGLAEALHSRGRHDESATACRNAIAAMPMTGSAAEAWALADVVERVVVIRGAGVVEEAVAAHHHPIHHGILSVAGAKGLARVGRLGEALAVVRTIEAPLVHALALLELVTVAGFAGGPAHEHPWVHEAIVWLDRDEPDEVVALLDVGSPDRELRARCAERLARVGLVDRAFAMVEGMAGGSFDRERALIRVGEALAVTDRWAEAVRALDAALGSAADSHDLRRARTLAGVVQQFAMAGHPTEGLARVRSWPDERERAEVLGNLGASLGIPSDRRTAVDVVRAAALAGDAETFARVAPEVRDGAARALTALQVARLLPSQAAAVAEEVVAVDWTTIGRRPSRSAP